MSHSGGYLLGLIFAKASGELMGWGVFVERSSECGEREQAILNKPQQAHVSRTSRAYTIDPDYQAECETIDILLILEFLPVPRQSPYDVSTAQTRH